MGQIRSTRRLELMEDGSHRSKSFVFYVYQDPNFDVVLSDQRLRNGTVKVPLVNEECNG